MATIEEDYVKADKIFKANCDDNSHPRSCQSYATNCFVGRGQPKPNYENVSLDIFVFILQQTYSIIHF